MSEGKPKHEKVYLLTHEPISSPRPSLEGSDGFPQIIRDFSMRATKIVLSDSRSATVELSDSLFGKELALANMAEHYPYIYVLRVYDENIAKNTGIVFEIQSSKYRGSANTWGHSTMAVSLDGSKIELQAIDEDVHFLNSPLCLQSSLDEIARDYITDHDQIFLNTVLESFERIY